MAISLDDINVLVWKYLSENGFNHTAFLFKSESMIDASDSQSLQLPSGLLISILQKSLLYIKNEKRLNEAKKNSDDELNKLILSLENQYPEPIPPSQSEETILVEKTHNMRISGATASILTNHKKCVFACKFSNNGSQLVTASEDGTTILWNMNDGVPTNYKILSDPSNPQDSADYGITSVDFDCTGTYFAAGSFDSFVRLYDNKGTLLVKLRGHKNNVFSVKFSPNGKSLISCAADKMALLWEIPSGNLIHLFGHHMDTILDVDWKDEKTFVAASADCNISICNINGSYTMIQAHISPVTAVAWSNNRKLLASASEDGTIKIWKEDFSYMIFKYDQKGISDVKWIPNRENLLVASSQDGSLTVWDTLTGACIQNVKGHLTDIIAMSISPNGKYIAVGGTNEFIDIINSLNGEIQITFTGSSAIYDIQWDPNSRFIAVCFDDSTVAIIPIYRYLQ